MDGQRSSRRAGEIALPTLQKGSSIMQGKVNPVLAEVVLQVAAQVLGKDTAITIDGMQGNFELNARVPMIARNLIDSLSIMSTAVTVFTDRCVSGIEANTERLEWLADNTLASATVLNPVVGYDGATRIVQHAQTTGLSVRQAAVASGIDGQILDDVLDPRQIARCNSGPMAPHTHAPHELTARRLIRPIALSRHPTSSSDVLDLTIYRIETWCPVTHPPSRPRQRRFALL